MGKVLTIDEMLELLTIRKHPSVPTMVGIVEAVAHHLATLVAAEVGCDHDAPDFAPGFGGTCATFSPRADGVREWPDDISMFDPSGDFGYPDDDDDLAARHGREQDALTGP